MASQPTNHHPEQHIRTKREMPTWWKFQKMCDALPHTQSGANCIFLTISKLIILPWTKRVKNTHIHSLTYTRTHINREKERKWMKKNNTTNTSPKHASYANTHIQHTVCFNNVLLIWSKHKIVQYEKCSNIDCRLTVDLIPLHLLSPPPPAAFFTLLLSHLHFISAHIHLPTK